MNTSISQIDLLELPESAPRAGLGSLYASEHVNEHVNEHVSEQTAQQMNQQTERKLPLASVEIQARVLGSVLDVEMRQDFRNTYQTPLEAIYIFPLPGAAAVYQFEITIADRKVRGAVQERQAAQQNYQEALEQGHRAALMQQERDDLYTLQVGNIPAGESVSVCLKYVQQLDYQAEGLYECRLPMVVAPRYIPGEYSDHSVPAGQGTASDTDLVPDASRISPPRLLPGFDPEIDFKLELSLQTGQGISELVCSQHASRTQIQADRITVSLTQQEALDRDFVLRWRTANTEQVQHTLYYSQGAETDQGYGLIELQAPAPAFLREQRREVLFLLDRSGSMDGYKMSAAAQACERLLNSLSPGDAFAIQAFDDRLQWLDANADEPNQANHSERPKRLWLTADQAGKDRGRRFLQAIEARGGTELYYAISEGLQIFSTASNSLPVIVLLTDGQVGDESRILKKIQTEMGQALIHTIGIDTALNDSFLKRLAQLGGGSHLSLTPREDLSQALESIAAEIGFPVLQDIQLKLPHLTPEPIPNLYAGRSLSLFFKGACPEQPSLKAHNGETEQAIAIKAVDFPALSQLWAHSRLQQLEDRFRLAEPGGKAELKSEMIQISCAQQVLCRLTAWLAIDQQQVIQNPDQIRQIVQPLAMPADWQGASPPCPAPLPPVMMQSAVYSAPMAAPTSQSPKANRKRAQAPSAPDLGALLQPDRSHNWLQQQAQAAFGGGSASGIAPASASPPLPEPLPAVASAPGFPRQALHLIEQFLTALVKVLNQLKAAQTPDAKGLERHSEALKSYLASADQAEHLPHTQRLLRQENQQLLRALASGHLQGLEPLLQRISLQIERVRSEVDGLAAGDSLDPAWEQSI